MPLGHLSALSASYLSLDLLASPSSSLDSAWLELAIGLDILDHSRDPVSSVVVCIFSVREGLC